MENKDKMDLAHFVSLLRKKHPEIGEEDAGRLYSEWITLVRESILREESIEIPHVGTFQCKPLSEPGGDEKRFLIDFTPSEKLRRGVNSYFAHFEPTLLNEGVTFNELPVVKMGEENIAVGSENVIVRASATPTPREVEMEAPTEELPEPEEAHTEALPEVKVTPGPVEPDVPKELSEPVDPDPPQKNVTNELAESLRQQPDTTRQRVVERSRKVKRGQKRSSIWVPIIGGVAIVVAGLFFFNRDTTER